MEKKVSLDLSALNKAVSSLEASIRDATDERFIQTLSDSQKQLVMAGVIQNFEFSYELCWKFMRRWLIANFGNSEVDGLPRRALFRLAHQNQLIEDVERWMFYHRARNQTSHTYDPVVAEEVFKVAQQFLSEVAFLQSQLAKKNV